MDWYIDNYALLLLILVVPLAGIVLWRYAKWKVDKKKHFADPKFQEALFESTTRFSKFFPVLYLAALFFLILSIVDVLKGSEKIITKQQVSNVIFVLDTSNSMNAEDVEPSRLIQAKNIILNTLSKMKGDRVGMVIFAGEAMSIMPLTTDYTAVDTYISGIETDMMKIQGTDFLKAMEESAKKFKNVPKGGRKVVLLSDGEDNEGNEKDAAKFAEKEGISVISVGIGGDDGAPVPEYVFGQLMGYKLDRNGQTVLTKRQTEALKAIAEKTGGSYINGNSIPQASAQIVEELSKSGGSSSLMVESKNAQHYYQYFLGISIVLFALIYFLNPQKDLNV